MKAKTISLISFSLLIVFVITISMPTAAMAGSKGARNTAVALTAATIAAALTKHKTAAIILGAGSAYAWKRQADARANEAYTKGYNDGHYSRYQGYHQSGNGRGHGLHKGWIKGRRIGWSHSCHR